MLTVAVTGPTGELGKPFMSALQRAPEVERVIGMARRPFDPERIRLGEGRVPAGRHPRPGAVEALVADADVVVHLAFVIVDDGGDGAEINRAGSRNVFAAAVDAGVKRLVYTSSVAAYGFHREPSRADHRGGARPRLRAPSLLGRQGGGRGRARGRRRRSETEAYVFRPCIVAGPEATLLLDMVPLLALGQKLPGPVRWALGRTPSLRPVLPDPGVRFQLVHHDDVAAALTAAAIGIGEPGVYNLAGPGELTITDLAHELGWHASVSRRRGSPSGSPPRRSPTSLVPARRGAWIEAVRRPMLMDTTSARQRAALDAPPRRPRDPARDDRGRPRVAAEARQRRPARSGRASVRRAKASGSARTCSASSRAGRDPEAPAPSRGDAIEQRREALLAEPLEHERVEDDRDEAALVGEPLELALEEGEEGAGIDRVGRAGHLARGPTERRAARRLASTWRQRKGSRASAVLDARARPGRRAVAQARPRAGPRGRPSPSCPPGGRMPGQLQPELCEGRDARGRGSRPARRRSRLGPLLVAPGVVGDLVARRRRSAQQLGVELGVQPLDEEGRAQPAAASSLEQRRQRPVAVGWSPSGRPGDRAPSSISAASPRLSKVRQSAPRTRRASCSLLQQRRAPALRFARGLLARPAEVVVGRGEQDREVEQAGDGRSAASPRPVSVRQAEDAGDRPRPRAPRCRRGAAPRSGPRLRRASARRRAATTARP